MTVDQMAAPFDSFEIGLSSKFGQLECVAYRVM